MIFGLSAGLSEPASDTLHTSVVAADRVAVVSRTDTMSVSNSFSATDILLRATGFHVSDNGGASGLKTLSLRGMGSAHTSVYVDGLRVGNVQSGQNDLGMIATDHLSDVTVDYAQNSVSFNTARPVFRDSPVAGAVRLSAGSFGTWRPSVRMDFRMSDSMALSVSGSGSISKGNFKYGEGLVRENNDIRQVRAGVDLWGQTTDGDYHLKAYYNGVERGTPGSVDWPSDDRQSDRNFFVQGVLTRSFSKIYSLRLGTKTSWDDIFYSSAWGDSRYQQAELQLNSLHTFRIYDWWKLSAAADIQWDALASTNYAASRLSVVSTLSSSFRTDRFSADAAVEFTGASDHGYCTRTALSPSLQMRLILTEYLSLTSFARRSYRVPTFNELYYVGYGNPDLRPESAWIADIGADFSVPAGNSWRISARLDGFYNHLSDKITSAPTPEDPAIWAPYNIGKVASAGVDASAGMVHEGEWRYSLDAKYSFLSAVDKTEGSYTFGQQIPYISRHSLVVTGSVAWKDWALEPVWNMRGGRTDSAGELPDWNTLDLAMTKSLNIRGCCGLVLRLSAYNILNCRYETVIGYPMPGRSIIGGIEIKF